jgi:hypothetical protein
MELQSIALASFNVGYIIAVQIKVDDIDSMELSLLKRDLFEWMLERAPDMKTPDSNEEDKSMITVG